ncbi:LysR family transcriptional regulator [Nocardia goodfellowii]|uniref:DNA-binding transcriptional LysR family regulator n=1 Tax=Nocardia goodfellowii TaxID=882446 RepID=A0ABS4QGM7_9NOCA|nr:LysR substrate-binding domain-containing protein [Nocardia goodfellowii]MBP2190825.1 DNA-binding transcriptional LysR family regulator [Nocardia goodfellowii]
MDLARHLHYFLTVAGELHFGRAAETLGIAQPPLSQSIQRLERELGAQLFDRSRRSISLTAAGELLVEEARALLAAEQRLRTVLRKAAAGELGMLRVGVLAETPAPTLQALLRLFAEQAPALTLDLQELTTAEQLRLLATAELDVGLVLQPIDAPELVQGPTAAVPLGVVLPRTSPLARLAEVDLSDLAGHDLILPPRATAPGWHDHVLEVCRTRGFEPARIRHARNPEFALGLVLAGNGVTFLQETLARREPRAAWRPLSDRPLVRRVVAVWSGAAAHPAVPRFAAAATAVLAADNLPTPLLTPDAGQPWSVVYSRNPVDPLR